ncbi:MAG TPA: GNAT family N-acetyltransferase [Allosphingosinicella sp.]|uniref:GNAT family N-acetyltransferase n=1 Tax=Allosphingosinicella sp. TaxID=2823234 RepID=UPI002F274D14
MLHIPLKPARAITVEVVPGFAAVIDQVAQAADPRHAFLRRAWFAAAGGRNPLTLVATRPDGRVLAALPTVAAATRLLGIRAIPGSYWPVRSFPVAREATDGELASIFASSAARRALGRAWRLGPVNADDPTASRLVGVAAQGGWTVLKRRIAISFTLEIVAARAAGPWPRASTLKKNRFHEKHLAGHGPLNWRFLSGADWTPALFDQLAAVEQASWIGDEPGADAKFCNPRQRGIWERAAADPELAGMMHVGLLEVGGAPAAFSFGIEAGRTRYCIATSYDRRFAKHSPGKLVSYRTYMDAAERGIAMLDDGAGDGGHKGVMGETPGPDILDYLFVRSRLAAALIRRFWR